MALAGEGDAVVAEGVGVRLAGDGIRVWVAVPVLDNVRLHEVVRVCPPLGMRLRVRVPVGVRVRVRRPCALRDSDRVSVSDSEALALTALLQVLVTVAVVVADAVPVHVSGSVTARLRVRLGVADPVPLRTCELLPVRVLDTEAVGRGVAVSERERERVALASAMALTERVGEAEADTEAERMECVPVREPEQDWDAERAGDSDVLPVVVGGEDAVAVAVPEAVAVTLSVQDPMTLTVPVLERHVLKLQVGLALRDTEEDGVAVAEGGLPLPLRVGVSIPDAAHDPVRVRVRLSDTRPVCDLERETERLRLRGEGVALVVSDVTERDSVGVTARVPVRVPVETDAVGVCVPRDTLASSVCVGGDGVCEWVEIVRLRVGSGPVAVSVGARLAVFEGDGESVTLKTAVSVGGLRVGVGRIVLVNVAVGVVVGGDRVRDRLLVTVGGEAVVVGVAVQLREGERLGVCVRDAVRTGLSVTLIVAVALKVVVTVRVDVMLSGRETEGVEEAETDAEGEIDRWLGVTVRVRL